MARILLKSIFLIIIIILSAQAEGRENIRVLVLENTPAVIIESPSGFDLPEGLNSKSIEIDKDGISHNPFRITSQGDHLLLNGKRYRGSLEVRKNDKGLYVINELDIEDYLKGVVPQEIDHRWHMEALKAQAVVARTYAFYHRGKNQEKEYHLGASILSQVYNGMDVEKFRATYAVMATEGMVLTYEGKVIEAFYHKSCGGYTANSEDVWSKNIPYLRGVECPETSETWERTITLKEVEDALREDGKDLGRILRVEIASTNDTGRVTYLRIENGNEPLYIKANDFRRIFGYTRIPSANFRIEEKGEEIKIFGKGAGHGVGFCQFGAKDMAEKGKGFIEILKHYYRGIEIGSIRDL